MKLYDDEAADIMSAILVQAVEDYRELTRLHLSRSIDRHGGQYSIEELEQFFAGEFCEWMLQTGLGLHKTEGADLLRAAAS